MFEIRPRQVPTAPRSADADESISRIDLHLHTSASGVATNWWVKSLGLGVATQESHTTPAEAWSMVKLAGMDFVTVTDHESMDGVFTLLDRPDVLTGEEIASVFPEDGSVVDVLVYGLSLDQHHLLQALRPDVYRLVAALREIDLPYVLAHPLFAPEGSLTRTMVEKRMVLFPLWETINGSRPAAQNRLAAMVAASADASTLRQLAVLHRLAAPLHIRIASVAGSDDHGGIYGGTAWTAMPRVATPAEVLDALRAGEVWAGGEDGSVDKMVHTGCRIASHAIASGGQIDNPGEQASKIAAALPLLALLPTDQIRRVVGLRYRQQVSAALSPGSNPARMVELIGMAGKFVEAHMPLAPHLGVSGYFGRERQKAVALAGLLPRTATSEPVRV
ncbi:MAG: PHP domain-containing protein, partial [Thermomicrobiales bacterium]